MDCEEIKTLFNEVIGSVVTGGEEVDDWLSVFVTRKR